MGRELRARFRGTLFGPLWMLIQPLLFLVVYFTVFVQFFNMSGNLPPEIGGDHPLRPLYEDNAKAVFALSMFVGLIPWIALSETIARATGCIMENGSLIKKLAFPSELLPVYLVGVSLVNTAVSMVVLAVAIFLILGGTTPEMLWLLPLMLILQGIFTLGLAYIVSATAVFIRDLMQMVPILLTFIFFLSPIFYVTKTVQSDLAWIMEWNPVTYVIEPYRQMFVFFPGLFPETSVGEAPWRMVGILAVVALSTLFVGYHIFMRLKPRFADEV